jgi:hypothetical protein
MFAKQNMLFVKNTGIKNFLLISLFFLYGPCLMASTCYVAPSTENLSCLAMIIYFLEVYSDL